MAIATLNIPLDTGLTAEDARAIFARGEEAIVCCEDCTTSFSVTEPASRSRRCRQRDPSCCGSERRVTGAGSIELAGTAKRKRCRQLVVAENHSLEGLGIGRRRCGRSLLRPGAFCSETVALPCFDQDAGRLIPACCTTRMLAECLHASGQNLFFQSQQQRSTRYPFARCWSVNWYSNSNSRRTA